MRRWTTVMLAMLAGCSQGDDAATSVNLTQSDEPVLPSPTPTPEALVHASVIIAAFAANPGAGVVGIDGMMFDRPHLIRAERLLERAKKGRQR